MICPKCSMEVEEGKLTCPFCGIVFARFFADQENPFPPEETVQPVILTQNTQPVQRSGFGLRNVALILLFGAIALGVLYSRGTSGQLPYDDLHAYSSQSARNPFLESDKDVFVVVYLAPWCGPCRSSIRTVNELADQYRGSKEVSVVAFVGNDDRESLKEMASDIDAPTYLDLDGSARRSLGVRVFPTWVVARSDGKVIRKITGTWRPVSAHVEKLGLANL